MSQDVYALLLKRIEKLRSGLYGHCSCDGCNAGRIKALEEDDALAKEMPHISVPSAGGPYRTAAPVPTKTSGEAYQRDTDIFQKTLSGSRLTVMKTMLTETDVFVALMAALSKFEDRIETLEKWRARQAKHVHCDVAIESSAPNSRDFCDAPIAFECVCQRCSREHPLYRFHSCADHREQAGRRHKQIYERLTEWVAV